MDRIRCAGCQGDNLHHYRVEVFERQGEDAAIGVHVTVESGNALTNISMEGNPSDRRDGVKILLYCEHCEIITIFDILQHKGTTYLNRSVSQERRSIIVPDQNPDLTLWDAIQAAERAWRAKNGM